MGDWVPAAIFVFGMVVAPYLYMAWVHYVDRRWPKE